MNYINKFPRGGSKLDDKISIDGGNLDFNGMKLMNISEGIDDNDVVTRGYVDRHIAGGGVDLTGYLKLDGSREMTGNLEMDGHHVRN